MGKQYNKVIKRRRRNAYHVRKKTLAKQGITRMARPARGHDVDSDAAKKSAKKATVVSKKVAKAPAKKAAKPAEETVVETPIVAVETPVAATETPVAAVEIPVAAAEPEVEHQNTVAAEVETPSTESSDRAEA